MERYVQEDPSSPVLGRGENPMESLVIMNTTVPNMNGQNNFTATINVVGSDEAAPEHMSFQSLFMCILCIIFMCWCTVPRSPGSRGLSARIRFHRQQRSERSRRMKDPKYREEILRNSLYIQKVLKAQDGELTLGPPDLETNDNDDDDDDNDHSASGRESVESLSDEANTCIICLEPYQVGDLVAWSRRTPLCGCLPTTSSASTTQADVENGEEDGGTEVGGASTTHAQQDYVCNHVFHKDCIYSWLMNPKHDDCPACRAKITQEPPEAEEGDLAMKPSESVDTAADTEIFEQGGSFSSSVAFVVVHGLVSRVRRASYGLIGPNIDDEAFEDDERHEVEIAPIPVDVPPAFPIRRVASYGDRPVRTFLRRRSFGSLKESSNETSGILKEEVSLEPLPLRKTFSGGAISMGTRVAGGGTVLILKPDFAVKRPPPPKNFAPTAPRPVWSVEAERALGESLGARMSAAPRIVPTEIQGPVGLHKVFRRNPSDGFSAVPPPMVPSSIPHNETRRKRASYALLDSSEFSDLDDTSASNSMDAAGIV